MQKTRCKIKLSFAAGESAITSCLSSLRGFFQQMQRMTDRKVTLLPWEEDDIDDLEPIIRSSGMPLTVAGTCGCIPFFSFAKVLGEEQNI